MKRQGFTLIEMLVVIAIIGICVALTIPYFVEAQRAAGLRSSAQTVIMTAKYARSMSILKQVDLAMLVDRGAGQIELVSLSQPPGADEQSKFIDQRNARALRTADGTTPGYSSADGTADTNSLPPPPAIKSELVRELEEGVTIQKLEVPGDDAGVAKDVSWIFFSRNGTSSGFTIRIQDSRGSAIDIDMDGISGLVKTKALKKGET